MEPLIYTPLVLAKNHDGTSAVDLSSILNRKYQTQRMSSNPQYANTLSALTDYHPIQLHPTDHWLPQIPTQAAPGIKTKLWEEHFLDLYAPTPPPLLAAVPPQPKKTKQAKQALAKSKAKANKLKSAKAIFKKAKAKSDKEQEAEVSDDSFLQLPSMLSREEHVQSMITPLMDNQQHLIPFHDLEAEHQQQLHSRDVNIFAPANSIQQQQQPEHQTSDIGVDQSFVEQEQQSNEAPLLPLWTQQQGQYGQKY